MRNTRSLGGGGGTSCILSGPSKPPKASVFKKNFSESFGKKVMERKENEQTI
jgi:hypothetical protein